MDRNLVISEIIGTLRNNWGEGVGYRFTVGDTPIRVKQLGRWVVEGNEETHLLRLSEVSSEDDLRSVTVDTDGATAGDFLYGDITPITLLAGRTYALVSMENNGGDDFLEHDSIIGPSGFVKGVNPVYWNNPPHELILQNEPDRGYGLVDLVFDVPILDWYPTPEFGGPWIAKLTDLEDEHLTTQSDVYKDGGVDTNLDAPDPVKRFQLDYNGLTEYEAFILDQHYQAAKGKTYEFNFKHPRSGIVYVCQYEEGRSPDHSKMWIQKRSTKLICRPV